MENKEIVYETLKSILETYNGSESLFLKYLSKEFTLRVDGKLHTYDDVISQLEILHKTVPKHEIEFVTLIQEGNKVFSHHIVKSINEAGNISNIEVISEFTVVDGIIQNCVELTHTMNAKD